MRSFNKNNLINGDVMRKVFLDNLPKWEYGKNKGDIRWEYCVGEKVNFIYNDINDYLEIVDYDNKKYYLKLKYKDNVKDMFVGGLIDCKIGNLIGSYNKDYIYKINEIIEGVKSGKLKIIKQIRMKSGKYLTKGYTYECQICGNVDNLNEYDLKEKKGCNVCCGRKAMKGYNDLWTIRPDIAKLLKNKEKGFDLTIYSGKKEIFICPICNHESRKVVHSVTRNNEYTCANCSDGISYPEKFFSSVLTQLKIVYERQVKFEWSNNRLYDFFIPKKNCIIETHGGQHYYDSFKNLNSRTLEQEKNNDVFKEENAYSNGISNYITIDCRESSLIHIKNSILNSDLVNMFDLSKIDWLKCHEFACKTLVKDACDLWNSGLRNTTEVAKILKISNTTVRAYLKKGSEIGWCEYKPKTVLIENVNKAVEKTKKKVIQISILNEFIKEWDSVTEVHKMTEIHISSISRVCSGKQKTAGGYKWVFKEDYDQYIENKIINLI